MTTPFSIDADTGMADLRRRISLLPPEKQEAVSERVRQLKEQGLSTTAINSQLRQAIQTQRDKVGAVGTKTHAASMRESGAVTAPPETQSSPSLLGDKSKGLFAAAASIPNLPRDVADVSALAGRYLTPQGWMQGDKYLENYNKFKARLDESVPIFRELADAREVARDNYLETTNNKPLGKALLFAGEVGVDPTNFSPKGLVVAGSKVAGKLGGLAVLRKVLKSADSFAAHTPLGTADRTLLRGALDSTDTAQLGETAVKLADKGDRARDAAEFLGGRGRQARKQIDLAAATEERSYELLQRAEEVNAARKKYGVYLDEARFTGAELSAANASLEATSARELLRHVPETEMQNLGEVVKGIAKKEAAKAQKFGSKAKPMARLLGFFEKNFSSRGGIPDDIFLDRIRAEQSGTLGLFDMAQKSHKVRDLIENKYKDPAMMETLGKYIVGNPEAGSLPGDVMILADEMRESLIDLSTTLMKDPDVAPKLAKKIETELGKYQHRDFEVVENPFWQNDIDPKDVETARDFLRRNHDLTEDQVEGLVRAGTTFNNNPFMIVNEDLVTRAGQTVLRPRRKLPPALLALMGEHTDPLHKSMRSAYYMNLAAAELKFNRELGPRLAEHAMGIKSPVPTAQFTRELPQTPGYFVTDDVAQVLEEQTRLSTESVSMALNGLTKAHQTVLSPATHFKNFFSNGWTALALGHSPLSPEMLSRARSGARLLRTEDPIPDALVSEWARELIGEGALGANIDIGDMLEFKSSLAKYSRKIAGKTAAGKYQDVTDFGAKWYLAGDNFWKIYIYGKEIEQYTAAFMKSGIPQEAATKMAKEKAVIVVRDATQNYNFLPKIGRKLRRSAIVGPFASFPLESTRNFANLAKITSTDLMDSATRAIGLRRIAGTLAMSTIEPAMSGLMSYSTGVARNTVKHANVFLPDYHQDRELAPVSWDGKTFEYLNIGENNYYNYPLSITRSAINPAENNTEWALRLLKSVGEPVLGPTLIAGPLMEGANAASEGENYVAAAGKEFGSNLTPGFIKQPLEIARAGGVPGVREIMGAQPMSRGDRSAIEEAGGQITSVRRYQVDVERRFSGMVASALRKANSHKNKAQRYENPLDQQQAQKDYQQEWRSAGEKTLYLIEQLRGMGVEDGMILGWMKGYRKEDRYELLQGRVPAAHLGGQ